MKVLIDEGLPQQIRHYLSGHEVATVGYMGCRGIKNGKLLDLAEADGFDVLLTGDQRLPFQQNIGKRKIAVVILVAKNLQLETLEPLVPSMRNALKGLGPGEVVLVEGSAIRGLD